MMTYAPGIIAANRQAVWDLSATAGPRMKGMDLGGQGVFPTDFGSTELVDVRIPFKGGAARIWPGMDSGGNPKGRPLIKAHHCDFDMVGGNNLPHCLISGGVGLFTNCRFLNAPRAFINWVGPLSIYDSFIGAFGTATTKDDHTEAVQFWGGNLTLVNVMFDPSQGMKILGGITSALYLETLAGLPIFALMDGCVTTGMAAYHMPYTIQLGAGKADIWFVVQNSVLENGSSGYFGITEENGFKVHVINGGGNFDLVTGQAVTW